MTAGEQLDGQDLYEQQKARRAGDIVPYAPTIIAAHLRSAENMGSCLRIADAVGSRRVIFISEPGGVKAARIRKVSRHSHKYIDWLMCSQAEFLAQHLGSIKPLYALELTSTSSDIYETELPLDFALMIGNERDGIPAALLDVCDGALHIPMYGVNGSMNVAAALAIAVYEWRRRHRDS